MAELALVVFVPWDAVHLEQKSHGPNQQGSDKKLDKAIGRARPSAGAMDVRQLIACHRQEHVAATRQDE